MKKVILALSILLCGLTYGQQVTFEEVTTKKAKGKYEQYRSQSGSIYSVGDTLTIGVPFRNEVFDFIQQNAGLTFYPLGLIASGQMVVIKEIAVGRGVCVVKTEKPQTGSFGLLVTNFENALNHGELK